MWPSGIMHAMQRLLQSGAASQAEVDAAKERLRVADSDVHLLQQKMKGRYSQRKWDMSRRKRRKLKPHCKPRRNC